MNIKSPENIKNNPNFSIEQAGEIFSKLFENTENQGVVVKLFEGLPGLARQQKVEETIKMAKGGLQDLKKQVNI